MKIYFTKKQYEALAKTVYLGNWMANALRTGQKGDPHMKEYKEITDYVFSLAPEFGYPKTFEHDLECSEHSNGAEVYRMHEEYDEEIFWGELCDMLGERDFFSKYTKEEIENMDDDEIYTKRMEYDAVWEVEIEEHGIERLHILNPKTTSRST